MPAFELVGRGVMTVGEFARPHLRISHPGVLERLHVYHVEWPACVAASRSRILDRLVDHKWRP